MTGEHDTGSTPTMARAIHAGIARSRVVILPGYRHSPLIEATADVSDTIRPSMCNVVSVPSGCKGPSEQWEISRSMRVTSSDEDRWDTTMQTFLVPLEPTGEQSVGREEGNDLGQHLGSRQQKTSKPPGRPACASA